MIVSFMGPAAGFLLFILILAIMRAMGLTNADVMNVTASNERYYWYHALDFLMFMNLYWGLLNLLPVIPLDGGYLLQSLCQIVGFRNPLDVAMKVGVVVSGAAAYYFFVTTRQTFAGMLMLMLCMQSIGALRSRP